MEKMLKVSAIIVFLSVLVSCSNDHGGQSAKETHSASTIPSPTVSAPTATPVPEPLRLASEKVGVGDVDRALTYLDLTVSDFPDSDAAFEARLIRSVIRVSEANSDRHILNSMQKGTDNVSPSLVGSDGLRKEADMIQTFIDEFNAAASSVESDVKYILENYQERKEKPLSLTYILTPSLPAKDLSFFESVGYPIPTESELADVKSYIIEATTAQLLDDVIDDGGYIDYAEYFYKVAAVMAGMVEEDHLTPIINEVMVLTENDKYDERRIDVQNYLDPAKQR